VDLPPGLQPLVLIPARKAGIALHGDLHPGEIHASGQGQHLTVDLGTTHHHDLVGIAGGTDGRAGGVHQHTAVGPEIRIAGDDDVGTPGQQAGQRLPGLAPHDDGFAQSEALEVLQIRRQMPGQSIALADETITVQGGDQGDEWLLHARNDNGPAGKNPFR